ncbi:MAG: YbaN family protein [Anaerolineaceae bacterium]
MEKIVKGVLIGVGTVSVGLGLLGMFVPLLPTTPLLLLAAICYARSSKRFYLWLMTNRLFGEYIRNYREGRGIALMHKVMALMLLWATIGYAAWILVSAWWGKAGLIAIAVAVTIHLLMFKTLRIQKMTRQELAATPEESGSVLE